MLNDITLILGSKGARSETENWPKLGDFFTPLNPLKTPLKASCSRLTDGKSTFAFLGGTLLSLAPVVLQKNYLWRSTVYQVYQENIIFDN